MNLDEIIHLLAPPVITDEDRIMLSDLEKYILEQLKKEREGNNERSKATKR